MMARGTFNEIGNDWTFTMTCEVPQGEGDRPFSMEDLQGFVESIQEAFGESSISIDESLGGWLACGPSSW